jgi:hypothetical protein
MTETDAVYARLAEADGAMFTRSGEGEWSVKDKDGLTIAEHALSLAEAARLYCEEKGLPTSEEILDKIVAKFRPYHVLGEFWQGFRAGRRDSVFRCNPFRDDEGVRKQAWDRGADVAMQYQRALEQRASTQDEVDETEPRWLVTLFRKGRG